MALCNWFMFPKITFLFLRRMCHLVFPPLLVLLSSLLRIRNHPLVISHFSYYTMYDILCKTHINELLVGIELSSIISEENSPKCKYSANWRVFFGVFEK